MKPSTLSTERLILRKANEADAENLFRNYFSEISNAQFLTRKPHVNIGQTKKFLNEWCLIPWDQESNQFAWVIALADTNEGVGVFLAQPKDHKVEVHFGISHHFARQGLITEAGAAVIKWLEAQPIVERIWAVCDLANQGSIRVLEKLGFQQEGILKKWLVLPAFNDAARDCYIYARVV